MTEKPIPADFARDFEALFNDRQEIHLELSKYQAWCLMAVVQLAFRHPRARESTPMRSAVMLARALQEQIATTPTLARVAELGWTEQTDL